MSSKAKETIAWIVLLVSAVLYFGGGNLPLPVVSGGEHHYLINEDTTPNVPYTKEQQEALSSAKTGTIHRWLDSNSTVVNGTPERRVWDVKIDTTNESKFWQDAEKHDHGTLPSVETYNGRTWSKPVTFHNEAELQSILGEKSNTGED